MVRSHIERALSVYCGPGVHELGFDPLSRDYDQCRACGRRQRVDGRTCLICEADGEGQYVLVNRVEDWRVEGPLCPACANELRFRPAVGGWALVIDAGAVTAAS